jgi:hypothetical protein
MLADCFVNAAGKRLLAVCVKGQLSDLQRNNCETIARNFNVQVTVEQVRRSLSTYLANCHLSAELRDEAFEK